MNESDAVQLALRLLANLIHYQSGKSHEADDIKLVASEIMAVYRIGLKEDK